jgi:hypothetical protein
MAVAGGQDISSSWIARKRSQWQLFTREGRKSMTVLSVVSEITKSDSAVVLAAVRRSSQ